MKNSLSLLTLTVSLALLSPLRAIAEEKMDVIVLFKGGARSARPAATYASPAAAIQERNGSSRPAPAAVLSAAPEAGAVQDLWLVNGYALSASPETLRELAQDPQVEMVIENFEVRSPDVQINSQGETAFEGNWGLEKMGVQDARKIMGLTGRWVRIGHLDTGVDISHPALRNKLAAWAEFDRYGRRVMSAPHDSGYHGTHTAGILVGGTPDEDMGVAPDAELLSAKVLNGNSGTIAQVIAGLQWVLDPDGDPGTNDGANILSMSLGAAGQYQVFELLVEQLLEAGVFPVFAVGNGGAGRADAPGNTPGAVGVGATTVSDDVAGFSGGGTTVWDGQMIMKPDLSAPGTGIASAAPGGKYMTLSGSSMATPHVAGVAALLMEAEPGIGPKEVLKRLQDTAVDLGAPGVDPRFGYGRVDALSALSIAKGRAVIRGTTKNGAGPLAASRILMKDSAGGTQNVLSCSKGRFALAVPPGRYTLEASYGASQSASQEVVVKVGDVGTVDFDFDASATAVDNLLVYPNPFKPSRGDTRVHFAGVPEETRIQIYSMSGSLVAEVTAAEAGQFTWDLADASGQPAASGIYFYLAQLTNEEGIQRKSGKLAVLR